MDFFAQIAQNKIVIRDEIREVTPPLFEEKKIKLNEGKFSPTEFTEKIRTKEELMLLLNEARAKYKPFLANLAPACKPIEKTVSFTEFTLDGKEKVTIPHYGGPEGYAKKTYEANFFIESVEADKSYVIDFEGVDYIATVYVNGICVGKHEGFFSPFAFEINGAIKSGDNLLTVEVENDYCYRGNDGNNPASHGDKLYAATGLGWDDPARGWHHCPPGMGIYGSVRLRIKERIYITDIFTRPLLNESKVEIWAEVFASDYVYTMPEFSVSIYGQNFPKTVIEKAIYKAECADFSPGYLLPIGEPEGEKLHLRHGLNVYKIKVDIPDVKKWSQNEPYLYQAQIEISVDGKKMDRRSCQFGMRSFIQDTASEKKGMFYLNGEKIKLRGANTMGFEQWDVLRGDFDTLIDDLLLAKICNMNFLRFTQRPVQREIYEYCDKLGIMAQTDLPLFACMRINKFAEGVRQAEEMEKLIRSHPSCIIVSLINEPSRNAHNQPHRHMLRDELEKFFLACDYVIKLNNPDRVMKYVDGDYDPPSDTMPDNHCYNLWYNGHNVDIGKMIKGYWCPVKPNWYYGCGEFGSEGLDFPEIMREYYPKEWLREPFDPGNIVRAQSGNFYQFFFPRPKSLEDWVSETQRHQAASMKTMTEAFRRNNDMVTFAIHLFIDAWPSGWMKTIMDFKRNPKPAFFEYRNALEPIMISFRTDRFTYFDGENIAIEAYLCNDTNTTEEYNIVYEVKNSAGEVVFRAESKATTDAMAAKYIGSPSFTVNGVADREAYTVTAFLIKDGTVITYNSETVEVFKKEAPVPTDENTVWICDLDFGEHTVAGEKITVSPYSMGKGHFVAMQDGNEINGHFKPLDFRYWYDADSGYITPIVKKTFTADGFTPILIAANAKWGQRFASEQVALAVAEKYYEGKRYIISTLEARRENPIADRFINYMNKKGKENKQS